MKHILLILILVFSLFAQAEAAPMLSDLDSLVWKNRVILIIETKNQNESLQLVKAQVAEIDDRDITWFIIKDDKALTNYPGQLSPEFVSNIRERLGPVKGKVILIGKDGEIKSQADHLTLDTIFSEIDAMPMRRLEMQQ